MPNHIHFLPFENLDQISRGKGIINHLIASRKVGAKALHSGITALPPRVPVPRHSHNTEEQVTVLRGRVAIWLDGEERICEEMDSTFISPGVEHEFVNVGEGTAYVMVIYGSVDVTRTFTSTGETVAIGSDGDQFLNR